MTICGRDFGLSLATQGKHNVSYLPITIALLRPFDRVHQPHCLHLDYGFFRAILLVLPFMGERQVSWFVREYTSIAKSSLTPPSVVAHSFGTGQLATLESDGRSFADLKAERRPLAA